MPVRPSGNQSDPSVDEVMRVLYFLENSGCSDKTVKALLNHVRRLSFDGSYTPQQQSQQQIEVTPSVIEEDQFIEDVTEIEQSILIFDLYSFLALNALKNLSLSAAENPKEERRYTYFPVHHDSQSLARSFKLMTSAKYGTTFVNPVIR